MIHLLLAVIYITFISLGLPDALLGAAWPTIYREFEVPLSYAGVVSTIICMGTIVSSLNSERVAKKLGSGKMTACSVALTALGLFGFSCCNAFWQLCLWAIPYGLGAGGVDAALNNYVALHYKSHHMNWLHCMWGIGAATGPYIMGWALSGGQPWNMGYRYISIFQVCLTLLLFLSLPLWRGQKQLHHRMAAAEKPLTAKEIFQIPGAKQIVVTFFCYCGLEQTAGLWAASYLVLKGGMAAVDAASYAAMFYLGITAGRGISGFLSFRLNDKNMIRLGCGIILLGIVAMLLPLGRFSALGGLLLVGLGCAPIYPSIIHSIPALFGAERSQAVIGVQMASAYVGFCVMPPLFGLIAGWISAALLPLFLLFLLVGMAGFHERLRKRAEGK
ncbi:MAG: MFS transporter [Bacillota bacterium]|nr:MFS transporter [Bacillota bacterium]